MLISSLKPTGGKVSKKSSHCKSKVLMSVHAQPHSDSHSGALCESLSVKLLMLENNCLTNSSKLIIT